MTEPIPIPLGTRAVAVPALPPPPPVPGPDVPLGARINTDLVSRNSSRLEFLRAMLSDQALDFLARAINSHAVTSKSPKALTKFKPTSRGDLWRWIAQRLDLTLNVELPLKEADNSV